MIEFDNTKYTLRLDDRTNDPSLSFIKDAAEETANALGMNYEEGPIVACSACRHFGCVCEIIATHKPECRYRLAATCSIGIECDHGYDICPICDTCTC